ncbi:MAG: hypothetical protein QNJ31_08165 [Candidatus Caenarcaniphilales bacterium]|nr:hypothetical protein [Candidatus Caenarcaniphilales bacterium]
MPLDIWSSILAIVLSVFAFSVFLLLNKKTELHLIEKQVEPASKEAQNVLIKNFLSFGEIPTKTKLISIMTSLARKHHVQLLSHLPIQNVIDNLIYYVIANDLLDPYKKKEISDKLIKLKTDPISSEDYLQMVADNEEAYIWKQKFIYSQLTKVLVCSSLFIVSLGVAITQFKGLPEQVNYLINWSLVCSISFSLFVVVYSVITILSHMSFFNKSENEDSSKLPLLEKSSRLINNSLNSGSKKLLFSPGNQQTSQQQHQQPLPTQKNSQRSNRMMSIDNVTNLNESQNNKATKNNSKTQTTNRPIKNDSLLMDSESQDKSQVDSFEPV